MVDRAHALMAGVFVLVIAALAIGFVLLFGNDGDDRVPYLIVSREPVAGLQVHSDVSYRGMKAGSVQDIRIDRDDPRNVLVLVGLRRGIPITRSTFARLDRKLVTGNADVVLDDDWSSEESVPTSEEKPGRIPLRPSFIGQLKEMAPRVLARVDVVSARLETLIPANAGENVDRLLTGLALAAEGLPKLEQELAAAAAELRPLGRQARGTLRRIDGLLAELQGATTEIEKLAASAAALSASGAQASQELVDETVPRANAALAGLAKMANSVERLAEALRERPQSLITGRSRRLPGPGEKGY